MSEQELNENIPQMLEALRERYTGRMEFVVRRAAGEGAYIGALNNKTGQVDRTFVPAYTDVPGVLRMLWFVGA